MAISTYTDRAAAEPEIAEELLKIRSTLELIGRGKSRGADRIALTYLDAANGFVPTVNWTYTDLEERVLAAGDLFREIGGDRPVVSIILPAIPENHVALWGAQVYGIANPINPMLEIEHMVDLMKAARSTVLVTLSPDNGDEHSQKAYTAALQVPSIKAVCMVGQGEAHRRIRQEHDITWKRFDVDELADKYSRATTSSVRSSGDQPAAYFHTGGTTSAPKLAVLTHHNLVSAALASNAHLGLSVDDVALGGLPLFHINGISVTALWPWTAGARVVLLGSSGFRNPKLLERFWDIAEAVGGTFVSGVPTVYQNLASRPPTDVQRQRLRMKFGVVGAAPLPWELRARFEAACQIPLIEGYGLTESACVATVGPRTGPVQPGSVGMSLAGLQVRAVEVDHDKRRVVRELGPGQVGTLVLQGPNVFAGYLDDKNNKRAWVEWKGEKWFDTGDLGTADDQGMWRLVGRSKDLIIRGGHNIDPAMIESALSQHPEVALAAAIGRPDRKLGEIPVAYVQLRPGSTCTSAELERFAAETIPERAAIPKRVSIVATMPLTAVGKIFKPALTCTEIQDVVRGALEMHSASGYEVEAVLDKEHGFVAHVTLMEASSQLADEIRGNLASYTFKSVVAGA